MFDKVLRNSTKSVRVANNNFHFGNCFLTFFYLMFICSLKFTLSIVFFNLSYLVLIEHNLSCTTIVNKINCNTVLNSFRHCICIYNTTKNFDCSINRSSGKSYISCIWQRIVQILGKSIGFLNTGLCNLNLLVEIDLASVCFIRNTNNICSVRKKLQILCKFLNGSQINTATFSSLQLLTKFLTGLNAYNGFISDIFL